ncbi:MAG: hypothetical protein KGJ86_04700 [Chloroflexota bacterium]|nr:hypothetical protein [Chloroflexota bacterium]
MGINEHIDRAVERYDELGKLRAPLQLIPVVGPVLDVIVSSTASRIQRERLEGFFADLRTACEALDQAKIDRKFLESEDFFDLFVATTERMLRTGAAAKREALRNVFVNGMLRDNSDGPFKEIALRIVGDLTPAHVVALAYAHRLAARFTAEQREAKSDFTPIQDLDEQLGSPESARTVAHDLLALGLLSNWWQGRYDAKSDSTTDRFSLTPLGRRLAEFITAPTP